MKTEEHEDSLVIAKPLASCPVGSFPIKILGQFLFYKAGNLHTIFICSKIIAIAFLFCYLYSV